MGFTQIKLPQAEFFRGPGAPCSRSAPDGDGRSNPQGRDARGPLTLEKSRASDFTAGVSKHGKKAPV